jgi:hypothetical protein
MDFPFYARDGHRLALIHYSIDGLVKVDSEYLVIIRPWMRKDWLPKLVRHDSITLPAASKAEVVAAQSPNKRARLV